MNRPFVGVVSALAILVGSCNPSDEPATTSMSATSSTTTAVGSEPEPTSDEGRELRYGMSPDQQLDYDLTVALMIEVTPAEDIESQPIGQLLQIVPASVAVEQTGTLVNVVVTGEAHNTLAVVANPVLVSGSFQGEIGDTPIDLDLDEGELIGVDLVSDAVTLWTVVDEGTSMSAIETGLPETRSAPALFDIGLVGPVLPVYQVQVGDEWIIKTPLQEAAGIVEMTAQIIGEEQIEGRDVVVIEVATVRELGSWSLVELIDARVDPFVRPNDSTLFDLRQVLEPLKESGQSIEVEYGDMLSTEQYWFDPDSGTVVQAEAASSVNYVVWVISSDGSRQVAAEYTISGESTRRLTENRKITPVERAVQLEVLQPDPVALAQDPLSSSTDHVFGPIPPERIPAIAEHLNQLDNSFFLSFGAGATQVDGEDVIVLSMIASGSHRGDAAFARTVADMLGEQTDAGVKEIDLEGVAVPHMTLAESDWLIVPTNTHLFIVIGGEAAGSEVASNLIAAPPSQELWQPGECFDFSFAYRSPHAPFGSVGRSHCLGTHTHEVIHFELLDDPPDAPYLARELEERRDFACEAAFLDYVGSLARDTTISMTTFWPDDAEWAEGDRYIACLVWVHDPEMGRVSNRSLRGAAAEYAVVRDPGDCLLEGGRPISCDEPHNGEVVGRGEHAGDASAPYPGLSAIEANAALACNDMLREAAPAAEGESDITVEAQLVTPFEWSQGIRGFNCIATLARSKSFDQRAVLGSLTSDWTLVTTGVLTVLEDTSMNADHHGNVRMVPGTTLDCAGHRVVGPAEPVGIATAPDTTVRNCIISGFNTGVGLGGQSGVTVENVTVTDSRIGFYLVSGTSDVVILDSRAEGNEIGFLFENSVENARLEGNVAFANWRSGFMIGFTTSSTFIDNEATGGGSGFWIANSRFNTFSGNHVSGASEWFSFGLFENTSDNVIENNEVTRGGVAFALGSGAANNTLRANTATDASKGFDISGGARDNDLVNNVSIGTHDGFWVGDDAGRGNALIGNRSERSTNWGFVDLTTGSSGDFGTASTYSNNVCVANGVDATPPQLC